MREKDYLRENILTQPGLVARWPLDDLSGSTYCRVLTPGQAVGRNIVLNATPTSATSWTLNANWAYASNLFTHTTGSTATVAQLLGAAVISGRAYSITYTVSGMTAGTITVSLGASGTARSANGTYTEIIVSSSTTLIFTPSSTFDGSISAFTVAEVNIPPGGCYYSNPTVIADGDMEAAGTASWTAGNSATLSKQTTTPHSGSQCLRVARNGSNNPSARQLSILTAGLVYRVTGYYRTDGNATVQVQSNGVQLFAGSVTTSWLAFDFIFVAVGTDISLLAITSTGTQYAEFDDVTVTIDQSLRLGELMQDGDMEASGVGSWPAANSATITKDTTVPHSGTQNLRVARNGVNNPIATQNVWVVGKRYRITGYCKSDGSATPRILHGDGTVLFAGTTSTSWQPFDVVFTALATNPLRLQSLTSTGTQYCEWDDISLTEVHPMVGLPNNGVVLQSPPLGHLFSAAFFDGSNDVVNIYSSCLNAVMNPAEGTMIAWAQVASPGVWTDAAIRRIFYLVVDGSNTLIIQRTSTDNQLNAQRIAGGTNTSGQSAKVPGRYVMVQLGMTWSKSADQLFLYVNGDKIATATGLGTFAGNLTATTACIGAGNGSTGGNGNWSGWINDVSLYNRPLTPLEMLKDYRKYHPRFATKGVAF